MAYFSIGLDMVATVYIRANSLTEAQGKLKPLFSEKIDAMDSRWFSDASFGSPALPEISFATAMLIRGPVAGEICRAVDAKDVDRLMSSSRDAGKPAVLFHSKKDRRPVGAVTLYWADLLVRTTGIVKVERMSDALEMFADLPSIHAGVHWEDADEWFGLKGFDNAELPLVLSSNIEVVAESDEARLREHWSVA